MSNWSFSKKVTCAFLLQKHIKEKSEINTFNPRETTIPPYYKGFKGTVVNLTLPYIYEWRVT